MADFVFSSLPVTVDSLVDASDVDAVRGVLNGLAPGEWKTSKRIEAELGWTRQGTAVRVRRAIKELQLVGFPVVESHAGFAIATCPSMVRRCIEKEMVRMKGMARTVAALQAIESRMAGQQSLSYHDYRLVDEHGSIMEE